MKVRFRIKRFDPDRIWQLVQEERVNVLAIVGEALSNIVRHAQARQAKISAHAANGRLTLSIQDDGRGMTNGLQAGYGLRNMRDRARLLGGQLEVTSASGKGTTITLDIPWKDER